MIIKVLVNDGLDAQPIREKLAAQFHDDISSLRTVQFWVGEVRRGR
jgi:hypothetical protein